MYTSWLCKIVRETPGLLQLTLNLSARPETFESEGQTWHGVGPEADVVHVSKEEEGDEAKDVGLIEDFEEFPAAVLHGGCP